MYCFCLHEVRIFVDTTALHPTAVKVRVLKLENGLTGVSCNHFIENSDI